jgi:hypothetical protein
MSASAAALLIDPRQRVVWTTDERRRLDRCAKDFNTHGDKLQLVCGSALCPEPRIVMHQDQTAPGGVVLRCGCTDRHFVPTC